MLDLLRGRTDTAPDATYSTPSIPASIAPTNPKAIVRSNGYSIDRGLSLASQLSGPSSQPTGTRGLHLGGRAVPMSTGTTS